MAPPTHIDMGCTHGKHYRTKCHECDSTWCDLCHPTHGPRCHFEDEHEEIIEVPPMFVSLNHAQRETLNNFRALAADDVQWFIGQTRDDGAVEVIALGNYGEDDREHPNWVWSFILYTDGDYSANEAQVTEFETGVTA